MTRPAAIVLTIAAIAGWGLAFSLAGRNVSLRCEISDLREMLDLKTDLAATMADRAIYSEQAATFTTLASFYGEDHRGRLMANQEPFNPDELTAASPWLPFGSKWRVTRISTGQSVTVRITDRGPNMRLGRGLDLSRAAAEAIGMIHKGVVRVTIAPEM
jgi:rare lipoprotein A